MQAALEKLKTMRILGHIEVRSFIVHRCHARAGVNFDVVIDISDEEFPRLLFSTVKVLDFHHFGLKRSWTLDECPASF